MRGMEWSIGMVHETGDATEKFLRSVALGEVNIEDVQAQGIHNSAKHFDQSATALCILSCLQSSGNESQSIPDYLELYGWKSFAWSISF